MENNKTQKQDELVTLEQMVKNNYLGGYGPFYLFQRLVKTYPCEFKNYVDKYHEGNMDTLNSNIRSVYLKTIETINILYTRFLLHICDPAFDGVQPDPDLLEKLEPLLKQQREQN